MPKEYVLKIQVDGAPSGSEQLGQQQGQISTRDETTIQQPTSRPTTPKTEQQIRQERINTVKKVTGTATAAGYIALDLYQQERSFAGDTNRNLRINEKKKQISQLAVAGGLLATGNVLGAALFVGYTALSYAKENRELINTVAIDKYKSNYYQQRLVYDTTQRSR